MKNSIVSLPGMAQVIDNKLWISLLEMNGLIRVDLESGLVDFIGSFVREQTDYMLHYHITSYHEKIIFLPWNVSNISIYDMKKKEFRNIEIDKEKRSKIGRIYTSISKDNYLYLISETTKGIIEFDLRQENITGYFLPQENVENDACSVNLKPFLLDQWLWKIDKSSAWRFNIQNKTYEQKDSFIPEKVMSVCESESDLWIVVDGFKVYQYTKAGKLECCYELGDCLNDWKNDNHCIESAFLNGKLIFIFHDQGTIVKIPVVDKRLDMKKMESIRYENSFFSVQKDAVVIFENNNITILADSREKKIKMQNGEKIVKDIMEARLWEKFPVLTESNNYTVTLTQYLKFLVDKNISKKTM